MVATYYTCKYRYQLFSYFSGYFMANAYYKFNK